MIWRKDNNNSGSAEEAKEAEGVRQKLLDCYRSLYFEAVEGLQPKDQVSRIAKNLVEGVIPSPFPSFLVRVLTAHSFYYTLAELTNLEVMMRILSEEGQIHRMSFPSFPRFIVCPPCVMALLYSYIPFYRFYPKQSETAAPWSYHHLGHTCLGKTQRVE